MARLTFGGPQNPDPQILHGFFPPEKKVVPWSLRLLWVRWTLHSHNPSKHLHRALMCVVMHGITHWGHTLLVAFALLHHGVFSRAPTCVVGFNHWCRVESRFMGHGSEVQSLVTGLDPQSWQDSLWGASKPRSTQHSWGGTAQHQLAWSVSITGAELSPGSWVMGARSGH